MGHVPFNLEVFERDISLNAESEMWHGSPTPITIGISAFYSQQPSPASATSLTEEFHCILGGFGTGRFTMAFRSQVFVLPGCIERHNVRVRLVILEAAK